MAEAANLVRISRPQFRRLMDEDPELSDLVLRALLARRHLLRAGPAAHTLEIVGSAFSAPALALRTYAARQQLPHVWVEADSPEGTATLAANGLGAMDLPAVVTPTVVLRRATPGMLAEVLGLSYRPAGTQVVDLVVVGAGPAGLAAAVYGASEGLHTLVLDSVAGGGQAAASSRIENYLGFTSGISGADLTANAMVQAQKFGARLSSPCQVTRLEAGGHDLKVVLADGTEIPARSVVIATGARYRSLPLERWDAFEGAGIYYAATELEAAGVHIQAGGRGGRGQQRRPGGFVPGRQGLHRGPCRTGGQPGRRDVLVPGGADPGPSGHRGPDALGGHRPGRRYPARRHHREPPGPGRRS